MMIISNDVASVIKTFPGNTIISTSLPTILNQPRFAYRQTDPAPTPYVLFVDYSSAFNTIAPSRLVSKMTLYIIALWWRRPTLPPLVAQRLSGPTEGAQELLHLPHWHHPVQENHHLDAPKRTFCILTFPIPEAQIHTAQTFYESS